MQLKHLFKLESEDKKLDFWQGFGIFSINSLTATIFILSGTVFLLNQKGMQGIQAYLAHIVCISIVFALIIASLLRRALQTFYNKDIPYSISSSKKVNKLLSIIAISSLLMSYTLHIALCISMVIIFLKPVFPEIVKHKDILALTAIVILGWINMRKTSRNESICSYLSYLFLFVVIATLVMFIAKDDSPILFSQAQKLSNIDMPLSGLIVTFSFGVVINSGIDIAYSNEQRFKHKKGAQISVFLTLVISIILIVLLAFAISHSSISFDDEHNIISQLVTTAYDNYFFVNFVQIVIALALLSAANNTLRTFILTFAKINKNINFVGSYKSDDLHVMSNSIFALCFLAFVLIIIFQDNIYKILAFYTFSMLLVFSIIFAKLGSFYYGNKANISIWWFKYLSSNIVLIVIVFLCSFILFEFLFTGLWVVLAMTLSIALCFIAIKHYYTRLAKDLILSIDEAIIEQSITKKQSPKVILVVLNVHKGLIKSLSFARTITDDITTILIPSNDEKIAQVKNLWQDLNIKEKLIVLKYDNNSLSSSVLKAIHKNDLRDKEKGMSIVMIPEIINIKWWHFFLNNQKSSLIKLALYNMDRHSNGPHSHIVISVPYKI